MKLKKVIAWLFCLSLIWVSNVAWGMEQLLDSEEEAVNLENNVAISASQATEEPASEMAEATNTEEKIKPLSELLESDNPVKDLLEKATEEALVENFNPNLEPTEADLETIENIPEEDELLPEMESEGFEAQTSTDNSNIALQDTVSGSCGKNLTWVLSEGQLNIKGTGAMVEHSYYQYPWYNYRDKITVISLNEGVTSISNNAFYECENLASITIPNTVTSIGDQSFYDCIKLSSLAIPNSVNSIGNEAFRNCSSLTEVILSDKLTSISQNMFYNCSKLASLTIPNSVTSIGSSAFINCTSLAGLIIPESVTSIGSSVFEGCSSLTKINYSGNLEQWYEIKLNYNPQLLAIKVNCKDTSINGSVFGTWILSKGQLDIKGTGAMADYNYDQYPWYAYRDKITTVSLSEGVTSISDYAFYNCYNLANIAIPNTVTSIGYQSFYDCIKLTSLAIPNSVTSIGNAAFSKCSNLTIYCYSNSAAHYYGEKNSLAYFLLDNHEHKFEVTDKVEPTCTEIGYQKYTCSVCKYTYSELSEPLGHDLPEEWTIDQEADCFNAGVKSKHCSRCKDKLNETVIPKLEHSFSTWIVTESATIYEKGSRYRICSRCNHNETQTTDKLYIDPSDPGYGIANFTIVDAATLEPIPNAKILIPTAKDGECTLITDEAGKASQIIPVGKQTISIYGEGYLTRNVNWIIKSGQQDIPAIGISTKPLVESNLTVTEMTYEEIVAAGIDTTAAGNEHVYKYAIEITFKPEVDVISLMAYFNSSGDFLGVFSGNSGEGEGEDGGEGSGEGEGDSEKIVYYHDSTNNGSGSGNGGLAKGLGYTLSDGSEVTIFPVSEYFYLIIYGETKWLKEMFDVEMLILNNSMTDTVEDCVASLSLPEGLSLASMVDGEQNSVVEVGNIDKASQKSIHWYVRGDKEGTYDVTASLTGKLMPFEEEFSYKYTAESPIKVYAGSAMHMTIKMPNSTYYGDNYTVSIELENVSNKPIYGISNAITGIEQGHVTHYSNGTVKEETYLTEGYQGAVSLSEFNPGDKMVIEVTTNILFESDLAQYQIDRLTGAVEQTKKLYNVYQCFKQGASLIGGAYSFIKSAHNMLDDIISRESILDTNLAKATGELASAVSGLMGNIEGGNKTEALEQINKLKSTGLYDQLYDIADNQKFYEAHTAVEIANIASSIKAMLSKDSAEPKFDIFESVKTAIEAIPIRFYLEDVVVTTLSGSTTSIPYSIEYTPGQARYFGVDNINKYLYSLIIAGVGEIDVPWYVNILGIDNDPTGYGKAVEYIKTTEKQIAAVSAVDATGETKFKAWIEKAGTDSSVETLDNQNSIQISCSNETAKFENGVLTFTGGGIIEILANGTEGGKLYIQAGEELIKTYEIEVYPDHECSSETWLTEIRPTDTESGLRTKYCDTCKELLDIQTITKCENEHQFGDYILDPESISGNSGLKYQECELCSYRKYELLSHSNPTSGTCGDNLTWTFTSDGTLTLSGSGAMTNWPEESLVPWIFYQADITTVMMANSLTSIGDYAFNGCNNLKDTYYFGSKEQWLQTEVGSYNDKLLASTIHYKVAEPTANPSGGGIISGSLVSLSTITEGSLIYYTTDGSKPTAASNLYTAPIIITEPTTIKAIAIKKEMEDSAVAIFHYTLEFFRGASLTLQSELAVNFQVSKDYVAGQEKGQAGVQFNGQEELVWDLAQDNGDCYSFNYLGMAAKEMADPIQAVLFKIGSDGTKQFSPVLNYSVADYMSKVLSSNSYSKNLKTFLVDLANYGTAAQDYFNYNTENPLNSVVAEYQSLSSGTIQFTEENSAYDITSSGKAIKDFELALKLENRIEVVLQVKDSGGHAVQDLVLQVEYYDLNGNLQTWQADGAEQDFVNDQVIFNKLSAEQMDDVFRISVLNREGEAVSELVRYSIASYAIDLPQESSNDALKDLTNKMVQMGRSAAKYFGYSKQQV